MILTIKMPFHISYSKPEDKTNVFDLESSMFLQTSNYMYKFISTMSGSEEDNVISDCNKQEIMQNLTKLLL